VKKGGNENPMDEATAKISDAPGPYGQVERGNHPQLTHFIADAQVSKWHEA
jgi:hypothetical protein